MSTKTSAIVALLLLTALNFLNYIDRNVLFAVQPLIQKEFHLDDAQIGFLTSAFFVCYMVAAPLIAPLADRYSRTWIMGAGAFVWSVATLLSAVTHNYDELLLRHVIVGIGEATFVAISPAFLADHVPGRNSRPRDGILLSGHAGGQCSGIYHRRISGASLRMARAVHDLGATGIWCWPLECWRCANRCAAPAIHRRQRGARLDSRPHPQQGVIGP